MRRYVLLLLCPGLLSAQLVSLGVKGGVPLTTAFDTARTGNLSYVSNTKRYLVGGAFELRFPLGLGLEFDALYKRLNYDSSQLQAGTTLASSTQANSWEFPLLFKLRAPSPILRPFFVAGPSFRHLSGVRQFVFNPVEGVRREISRPGELENRFSNGFTIGGGLEIGGRFRVVPEVRYTRWRWENFQSTTVPGFHSNQDQVDFLLGIHF